MTLEELKRYGTSLVRFAEDVATYAHQGQFRRDGITPYIGHPKAVAASLTNEIHKAVAWLHDVLEDTSVTSIDLFGLGFPKEVIDPVVILTKEGGDYGEYLKRIKKDPTAKAVKIADMEANLADSPTPKQIQKYTEGLKFLRDE